MGREIQCSFSKLVHHLSIYTARSVEVIFPRGSISRTKAVLGFKESFTNKLRYKDLAYNGAATKLRPCKTQAAPFRQV